MQSDRHALRPRAWPGGMNMANLQAATGNEIFNGGVEADTIPGNGGNDTLTGGGAGDVIAGGARRRHDQRAGRRRPALLGDVSPPEPALLRQPVVRPGPRPGNRGRHARRRRRQRHLHADDGNDLVTAAGVLDSIVGGAGDDNAYPGGADDAGATISANIEYIEWIEGSNFADTITCADTWSNFAPISAPAATTLFIGGYYTGNMGGGDGDDTLDRASSPYGFEMYGDRRRATTRCSAATTANTCSVARGSTSWRGARRSRPGSTAATATT